MILPCDPPEPALLAELMRWQSMREAGPVGEEELVCLAEVLAVRLTCEGYLLHEISRGEVQQLRSCDVRTLIASFLR